MTTNQVQTPQFVAAVTEGINPLKAYRRSLGYSLDEFSLTCGLSVVEILSLEQSTSAADPALLVRIETALRLSQGALQQYFKNGVEPGASPQ